MLDNTAFIGARGPLCKETGIVPASAPFIVDLRTVHSVHLQSEFQSIDVGDSLTCVLPPDGGNFWPLGINPSNSSAPSKSSIPYVSHPSGSYKLVPIRGAGRSSNVIGIMGGVVIVLAFVVAICFIRRRVFSRKATSYGQWKSNRNVRDGYSSLERTPGAVHL